MLWTCDHQVTHVISQRSIRRGCRTFLDVDMILFLHPSATRIWTSSMVMEDTWHSSAQKHLLRNKLCTLCGVCA
eukprot:205953-Amphidinium_carterae.1